MPYPALPPELPPVISVAAETAAPCASLVESASSGLSQVDFGKHRMVGSSGRSSAPETLPFQTSAKSAEVETLVEPEPPIASCAALLGNPTATGYLPNEAPAAPVVAATTPATPQIASRNPVSTRTIATPERLGRLPQTAPVPVPTSAAEKTANPTRFSPAPTRSPAYELSGVSGKLAAVPEKALMQSLNQALVFEALAESYQGLSRLKAEDLRRLARDRSTRIGQLSTPIETLPTPADALFPDGRFPAVPPLTPPAPIEGQPTPTPPLPEGTPPPATPDNVIEVTADRQEYDERRQIFTAEGNVKMRFRNALLEANRVQVNLPNRLTVAEGNVALTRGQQVLRGQRFEYNFVQGVGTVEKASGDIFLPTIGTDTAFATETAIGEQPALSRPLSDRITSQQPISNVASPGGISFSIGAGRDVNRLPGALPRGGQIRRLRFEAERVDFTPEGWVAENIDITNDPFSPPELVLRADRAVLTRLSPLEDEVVATRPRLVFDQKVSVPILRRRFLLSRAEQEPAFFRFGFDDQDRGGLFVEGILNVLSTNRVSFTIYPQIFLQRMIIGEDSEGVGDPDNFGVRASLNAFPGDRTALRARASLTSFDFDNLENRLRASARLEQFVLPTPFGFHRVGLEYSFRDRLFNGSLGFQTIQTSLGAVIQSPNIVLGNTGLVLNYQTGYQLITADTDRQELLEPVRDNNRTQLGRFQATAGIGRSFLLWSGKALPATRDAGLNYTPNPIVPQISFATSLRGVFSQYTNGDSQQDLIGTVGLSAQFGNFSKRFFDYTAIGVSYSQVIGSGQSPFLFDRTVDNRILSLALFQQLYGPVRAGVQTSYNLDTREAISTDIFLEYSRRTHAIILRYNPVLEIGSISFRVSDFNWTGTAEPFQGAGVVPVDAGVERRE